MECKNNTIIDLAMLRLYLWTIYHSLEYIHVDNSFIHNTLSRYVHVDNSYINNTLSLHVYVNNYILINNETVSIIIFILYKYVNIVLRCVFFTSTYTNKYILIIVSCNLLM